MLVCPLGFGLIRLGGAPPLAERVEVAAAEPQLFRFVFGIGEAGLALGIARHTLVAMEGSAGPQLGDELFPLLCVGLLR